MDSVSQRLSSSLKAYICSFSTGDLRVQRHGRKIRVESSSTHPAQIYLVHSIFEAHGELIEYPIRTPSAFGWRSVYHLSPKFQFLLDSRKRTYAALRARATFYFAIAGLIDSEGHIGISTASRSYYPVILISNSDLYLVRLILRSLVNRGYRARIQSRILGDGSRIHEVCLSGRSATRLLQRVELHHPEKIQAKRIVLASLSDPRKGRVAYLKLRASINHQRDACVEAAKIAFENRAERRLRRMEAYNDFAKLAAEMKSNGETIPRIGITLGRSQRTIYRLLRRNSVGKRNSEEGE